MFWLWLVLILLAGAGGFLAWLLRECFRRRAPKTPLPPEAAAFRDWLMTLDPEPVSVTSDDELTLRGTFVPRRDARGTALFLHARGSSWERDFPEAARFFYDRGFQLLFADQRCHGRSEGRFCTYGLWERFDARAWAHFLAWRCGERCPLFLVGCGEGAAAALMSAPLDYPGNLRGIVAESAYDLPRDYVAALLRTRGFPLADMLADALSRCTDALFEFGLKDYRALDAMRESDCPVLLLHGGADTLVSASDARMLRNACAAGGTLYVAGGAGHCACWRADPEGTAAALGAFLEAHIADTEDGEGPGA